jgi:hypothetical protein
MNKLRKFTFRYEGIEDKLYEHGRVIEYTFNGGMGYDTLTHKQVIEHFENFIRCCGYNVKVSSEDTNE